MISSYERENILNVQKNVDTKTNTSVTAKWFYLKGRPGDNVKIALTVNDELTRVKIFEIALTFIHHDKLTTLKHNLQKRKEKLSDMKNYADLSMNILYVFSIILLLSLITFGGQGITIRIKNKNMGKYLLSEIAKREDLVDNGHFVTAYELTEKYLKYFPDDTDIRAFRERLLDFTNDNPKTAQVAFVEAKKLMTRLKRHSEEPQKLLLSGDEKENLKALLPYHAELNTAYNKLVAIEEQNNLQQNIKEQKSHIKELIKRGNTQQALQVLNETEKLSMSDRDKFNNEIERVEKQCLEQFMDVGKLFNKGKISDGRKKLEIFLKKYPEYPDAKYLYNELQKVNTQTVFLLKFPDGGAPLRLYFKDQLTIGRADEGIMPDIAFDDRRISRNHLTIRHINGSINLSDNGSTSGTYIDGQKITNAVLKDRCMLNLAKIKEYKVLVHQDDKNITGGFALTAKDENFAVIFSALAFNLKGTEIFNQKDDLKIFFMDGIALISWQDDFAVLADNKKIDTPFGTFNVEAL